MSYPTFLGVLWWGLLRPSCYSRNLAALPPLHEKLMNKKGQKGYSEKLRTANKV